MVDDGSDDDTEQMVQDLGESRIHFYRRQSEPRGAPTCRNLGAGFSNGKYLIFLDSDDLLLPTALENRIKQFEKEPGLDMAVFVGEMFHKKPSDLKSLWGVPLQRDNLLRFLGADVPWQTTGPMWRKDFFVRIGGWKEGLLCGQDGELHLRALTHSPNYCFLPLVDHAIRADHESRGTLGTKGATREGQLSYVEALEDILKDHLMNQMNHSIRQVAGGRFLLHAHSLLCFDSRANRYAAIKIWEKARTYRLVSLPCFWLGQCYIKKFGSFVGDLSAWIFGKIGDPDFLLTKRGTLCQVPFECLGSSSLAKAYHQMPPFTQSSAPRHGLRRYLQRKLVSSVRFSLRKIKTITK